MIKSKNIYVPLKAAIKEVVDIGCDVKLFKVMPGHKIDYQPGQFFMVSGWGAGEVPISVTSTKGFQNHIEFAIKKAGSVTTALHKFRKTESLWIRGPYGNGFRTDTGRNKDILFIAGGMGIVPLRPLISLILKSKKRYRKIFLLYGTKKPSEILFKQDINAWKVKGVEAVLTVDRKDKKWKGNEGVVTDHLDKIKTDFKKAFAFVCGPDIMIENTMRELSSGGMPDRQIVTTLEARMKCGMGKCGQCYHGIEYICTNGPVYTYEEIKERKVYGP